MKEELKKELHDKILTEYIEYANNLLQYPTNKIIDLSYSIAIRREFTDMFCSDYNYDIDTIKFLLSQKNTLDYLYDYFSESDFELSGMLEDKVIYELDDEVQEYKNNLILDLMDNPNYDLYNRVNNILQQLDVYDLCDGIKSKFEIDEFDITNMCEILTDLGNRKYLSDYFSNISNEEQFKTLVEKQIISLDEINKIKEKLFPNSLNLKQDNIERTDR